MNGILAEIGKKVAERWSTLLVLPGLLFTAVAVVAVSLGQRNWAQIDRLLHTLQQLTADSQPQAGLPRTALLLVALLVLSTMSGFAARALGGPAGRLLAGNWPFFLRPLNTVLTRRRKRAWHDAATRHDEAVKADERDRLSTLAAQRNRISLAEPERPTWTGDRLRAPAVRVRKEYGLDLSTLWPRLWLVLPDTTREPLQESRKRFDEANTLGGWSVLYLVLGVVWWPSAILAACVAAAAWRRARTTAETYADLVESTVDVHFHDLVTKITDENGDIRPVSPQQGKIITERFRKGI